MVVPTRCRGLLAGRGRCVSLRAVEGVLSTLYNVPVLCTILQQKTCLSRQTCTIMSLGVVLPVINTEYLQPPQVIGSVSRSLVYSHVSPVVDTGKTRRRSYF